MAVVKSVQDEVIQEGVEAMKEAVRKIEVIRDNYQNVINKKNPDEVSEEEQDDDNSVIRQMDSFIHMIEEETGYIAE